MSSILTTGKDSTDDIMDSALRLALTFPFLIHRKTRLYINNPQSKIMFIMRGLSGSGKSTIVEFIQSTFENVIICSADHFFHQSDGRYVFDAKKLGLAHEESQQKSKMACKRGTSVVVIDNTNVKRWEMQPYLETANVNGYVVVLVEPKTPWKFDFKELARRNRFGVTEELIRRKVQTFEDVIPFYYGWFLNAFCSRQLQELADCHFKGCLKLFPVFKRELLQQQVSSHRSDIEGTDDEILSEYYSQDNRASPLLHCTSLFCNNGKVPEARAYHQLWNTQESCGKTYHLLITGLTITKKTMGARVTLNPVCSSLYKCPEEENWTGLGNELEADTTDRRKGKKKEKSPKGKKNKGHLRLKISNPGNCEDDVPARLNKLSLEDGNAFNEDSAAIGGTTESTSLKQLFPQLHNTGKGRSAHFTLKTATGVQSKETNSDVLSICDIEQRNFRQPALRPVKGGQACYYGDGICCVYFNEPIVMDTLFSGYY